MVRDSGTRLGGEGSTEWRLVTGVILFGGVGGERLAGAGNTMVPLPGCESSAVKTNKKSQQRSVHSNRMMLTNTTCCQDTEMHIQSVAG